VSYCSLVRKGEIDAYNTAYHDSEYGFPLHDDKVLFERLILEINQAGLSWVTILKKRKAFQSAYAGFDIDQVAGFGTADRERLLQDAGIIRNRLKIDAAIANAKIVQQLRQQHGSFANWLNSHHPQDLASWRKIFKQTFLFTGGEIVREFLVSAGYLPDAHDKDCPIYKKIAKLDPPWAWKSARKNAGSK
jgi:DNA-3-methyladenine glycosylase I